MWPPEESGGRSYSGLMPAPLPEREWTYRTIDHAEYLPDGRALWVAPEVQDIQRRLREGDPSLGWEGDPRLALYRAEADTRWYLYRLETDGQYRLVLRSRPDVSLITLIPWLVEHDTRRGFNAAEAVNAANEKLTRERDAAEHERAVEAMRKVIWGVNRDLGAMA